MNRMFSEDRTVSDHPLHKKIGDIVKLIEDEIPNTKVVLDTACGGTQHVQLFCKAVACCETRLCKVDILVLYNDLFRVILEIEESDIRPVNICGKASVSSLATHFIDKNTSYAKDAR